MIHGTFYGVILISFLIGIGVQWYFREYLQLLVLGHSIEVLFMVVLGWYQFGMLVLLPLLILWGIGLGAIYVMNRFA
ncbi:hypothetical protein [Lactiplantibacillus paraplantarum]|uniref:hypothetical protein n=1 Tax=Lactiplantibacillus paraplantarum TaxID=60520 RepID=UPI0023AB447D|nr:hypothetical protein [Lactiplantibacillus paraplantarum]WEE35140.1 hypothetical protein PWO93_10605 [Lactiplantibacillus paraplantarum]